MLDRQQGIAPVESAEIGTMRSDMAKLQLESARLRAAAKVEEVDKAAILGQPDNGPD